MSLAKRYTPDLMLPPPPPPPKMEQFEFFTVGFLGSYLPEAQLERRPAEQALANFRTELYVDFYLQKFVFVIQINILHTVQALATLQLERSPAEQALANFRTELYVDFYLEKFVFVLKK